MRKRNYHCKLHVPRELNGLRKEIPISRRDQWPTASVSVRHIYLHLWVRDYHGFGYEDNGGHRAAVRGFSNKFLDLLTYIYMGSVTIF